MFKWSQNILRDLRTSHYYVHKRRIYFLYRNINKILSKEKIVRLYVSKQAEFTLIFSLKC